MIALIFLYPIIKGFVFKFSSNNLKSDVHGVNSNISFIIALLLGVCVTKWIFIQHQPGVFQQIYNMIPPNAKVFIESTPIFIYVVILPVIIYIIYKVIEYMLEIISKLTFYPVLDKLGVTLNKGHSFLTRIFGALFQLPRAICYVLILTFILNIFTMLNLNGSFNKYLASSKPYNSVCKLVIIPIVNSNLARKLPSILDNSFRIQIKKAGIPTIDSINGKVASTDAKTIIYYNGVTLDDGVKSDEEINSFAKKLIIKDTNSIMKAKTLYDWVGANINYDHAKATSVLNNDFNIKSGAIPTYNTRAGICFDYSCLYVAMAKADGIKVRLVTGQGFNGVSWVSHAWNQVYIPEDGKWINVDTTFYKGGNYFNSKQFEFDHRNADIAGEW